MKIVTVIGARPQFIKAAAVSREIAKRPGLCEIIVHTGQHHDANMSDVFFQEMRIPRPDHHLDVHGGSHGDMTGKMLQALEPVIISERPDAVLVYGDTNSTLAGALVASKLHVPVAHVEAGLRSFNRRMPEEINRVLTDHLATWLFCPTDQAVRNLAREGLRGASVVRTGDVMVDAAFYYSALSDRGDSVVRRLGLSDFVLATVHRAENTDDPVRLAAIFDALRQIAAECQVVVPLHPRTRKQLTALGVSTSGIALLEPVGYFDMLALIRGACLVMTDSGGLQKEACIFGKPCVTLRDETEWVELVEGGANRLAGAGTTEVLAAYRAMLGADVLACAGLYGDGSASRSVIDALLAGGAS